MEKMVSDMQITGSATAILKTDVGNSIAVIGTEAIRQTFDSKTLQQIQNAADAPGVLETVLNPDAHVGYGAPIGCVMVSPTHLYPGPVGVDVKCSMSLLQFDLPEEEIRDKTIRRKLIQEICSRIPTGPGTGQRSVPKARLIALENAIQAVIQGASEEVCQKFGIPFEWTFRCEDPFHLGHDQTQKALENRLNNILSEPYMKNFESKMEQFGSYGGGNHFGECEKTQITDSDRMKTAANVFGLRDNCVSFLSHCGSRGFGNILAREQFRIMQEKFQETQTPFPGDDPQLVYARIGSYLANDYLDDMALGANFATVNHLLINSLILESFREVFPDIQAFFIYLISHNIVRRETLDNQSMLVHRKGATRAFPSGHPALVGTMFEKTGHPILLPGNPVSGSSVMVADQGARLSCFSINHGAGRQLGRNAANLALDQKTVNRTFDVADILTNCRNYPKDEAPDVYKNFDDVLQSVQQAGLASEVARLRALFVVKDGDKADD